jgi:ATP-dependent DNA helicase RecQ
MLKDLRKDISRKEKLPPFVIFQDPSLEDMAILYPVTLEELKQCTGVGTGKAQKYGDPFIASSRIMLRKTTSSGPMIWSSSRS